ncbi:MAG: DUF3821 domain-containing protein [Methanoregula sp.]
MNRYHIFPVLLAFFLLCVPASASLNKIAPGATVFIGETNLDISSPMNGHSVIAWWPAGADMSGTPGKTITISTQNVTKFNVSVSDFTGCTGKWYSHDTLPNILVFEVLAPQLDLKVWDLDRNTDITGKSVPMSENITYRIDTNLYLALNYVSRPNANPSDGFYTVKLTNPNGMSVPLIYTGNAGGKDTQILKFDSNPFVNTPIYYWKNGGGWDRNAKNVDGSALYPPGTYTFTASQNLNHMSDAYSAASADSLVGKLTSGDKTVTFIPEIFTTSPTTAPQQTATGSAGLTTAPVTAKTTLPTLQATTVIPVKTTFTPLPAWIVLAGIGAAALAVMMRRKY